MKRLIEIIESGYLNGSGAVLADGTVTSYLAGTSTLQALYQDFDCTTPHLNPLTLSAEGRATAYTNTRVKLVFKTAAGSTVRTVDNVGTADSDLTSASASDLAGDGLTASGGLMAVNPDGVTLEISSDQVRVKDSGVSTAKLAADAVTPAKASLCLDADEMSNLSVACSVGSNALTVALKSNAGTDCTATDFASIAFRSTTLTSGVYVRRSVTAATSIVISSGSTLGHVSAAEWPIFVYALDNAGTVELALSTSPVDERYRQSTTVLAGGGGDDSVSALYSTTARTNVAVRLIAVLKSTQTTAGTWAAVPTHVSAPTKAHPLAQMPIRPSHTTVGVGGVALSSSSGNFSTSSATYVDVTNLSITITTSGRPVCIGLINDGSGNSTELIGSTTAASYKMLRGATEIGRWLGTGDGQPGLEIDQMDFVAAGTYTYKLQALSTAGGGTAYVRYCKLVAHEI